jgi:hypothetical protein
MPAFDLIIGAGSALTRTGHPGFNALLLLDAIQPTGITHLQADPHGMIATLGALASVNPEAVVQVLDGSNLVRLGTSISLSGQPAAGKTAMKIRITTTNGEIIRHEVAGGHVWIYPLSAGSSVRVDVRVGRGLNIGGKSRLRLPVEGGSAGIIFDARGRPLALAQNPADRAAQIPVWIAEMTGDPLRVMETPAVSEETAAPEAAEASRKAGRKPARPERRRGRAEPKAQEPVIELEEEDSEDDTLAQLNKLRG